MKHNRYRVFYDRVDRDEVYSKGPARGDAFWDELEDFIRTFDLADKKLLEIGSGTGTLQDIVEDYVGVDVGESLKKFYHKPFFVIADEKYPFPGSTFDAIITRAVFEHIPDINKALHEMLRILKPGGVVLFSPAWQVRPWASSGYAIRPYKDLHWRGKLVKFSIPLRDNILSRLLFIIPQRFWRTLRFVFHPGAFCYLHYKKLVPNYEIMWDADADACNHIDPHAAILYFLAHHCSVIGYPNLLKAFFVRSGSLIVRKNL